MAFTATKDLMLPATVTGSWPRPRWYTENMWGRPLDVVRCVTQDLMVPVLWSRWK